MKKKNFFTMLLLVFLMLTPIAKADFWSGLRDFLIDSLSSSGSSSSSQTKNIVDGRVINPKNRNESRELEELREEGYRSKKIYENLKSSSSRVFYYECTTKPSSFYQQISYRTFFGYAKLPVYVINEGLEKCYKKEENGYKTGVFVTRIYMDDDLAKYIWENNLKIEKIGIYNAKMYNGYVFFEANSRVLINEKLVSIK